MGLVGGILLINDRNILKHLNSLSESIMLTSASIVTFNTTYEDIKNLIDSLTSSVLNKLYIIDNSRLSLLENRLMHSKIVYLHNPSNPGFGASHNIALLKSCVEEYDYHFVINPDIYMSPLVVSNMVYRMEIDKKNA